MGEYDGTTVLMGEYDWNAATHITVSDLRHMLLAAMPMHVCWVDVIRCMVTHMYHDQG